MRRKIFFTFIIIFLIIQNIFATDKLALEHDDTLLENIVTQISQDDFEYLMQTYFFKSMDIYKYLELVRNYVALRSGSFDIDLLHRLEQTIKDKLNIKDIDAEFVRPWLDIFVKQDVARLDTRDVIDAIIVFGCEENTNPIHAIELWETKLRKKGCDKFFITGGIGRGTKGLINMAPLSYPRAIKLVRRNGLRYIKFLITNREKPIYDFYAQDTDALKAQFGNDGFLNEFVTEGDIFLEAVLDRLINVYGYKRSDICILNDILVRNVKTGKFEILLKKDFSMYGFLSRDARQKAKITIFLENRSVTTIDNANKLFALMKAENIDLSRIVLVHNPLTQLRGENLITRVFMIHSKIDRFEQVSGNLTKDTELYPDYEWNKFAPISYTGRRVVYHLLSPREKFYVLCELIREIKMTDSFIDEFSFVPLMREYVNLLKQKDPDFIKWIDGINLEFVHGRYVFDVSIPKNMLFFGLQSLLNIAKHNRARFSILEWIFKMPKTTNSEDEIILRVLRYSACAL